MTDDARQDAATSVEQALKQPEYYGADRHEMLPYVPLEAKTLLEVGCGMGGFLACVKQERGLETWGVEAFPEAGHQAEKVADRIVLGKIEDVLPTLPDNYFDVVVFNDVLEHLIDPWAVLRSLRPKQTGRGVVLASIPNIRFYPSFWKIFRDAEWDYADQGIMDSTHLRFFTIKSIPKFFTACGYRLQKMDGVHLVALPWKFRLFNALVLRHGGDDMQYMHFFCVAEKNS